MSTAAWLPVAAAAFCWWFATGVILFLDGLPERSFRWSLSGISVLAGLSLIALPTLGESTAPAAAYGGFIAALCIWAWLEMTFLMGLITGPNTSKYRASNAKYTRFAQALDAILHHELAIVAVGALVIGLLWKAPNAVASQTFLVLWVMRTSAKLNLFLGVRNTGIEFLPPRLRYLGSYFRERPMNLLFPFTLLAASAVLLVMVLQLMQLATDSFAAVSITLVASLLALAIVEHLFMVLPLPMTFLWRWGLRSHRAAE